MRIYKVYDLIKDDASRSGFRMRHSTTTHDLASARRAAGLDAKEAADLFVYGRVKTNSHVVVQY